MNLDPFSSVTTCQKRILILFIVINRRAKVFHLNAFSSPVFCLWHFFVCSLATLWRWPVLYLLRSEHGQQRSTNLCRREAFVWAGSLPVWIPFHGWEHQKSSGDGKGPSSGWADSEQRELWRSATSPGEQGPGSKLCPGPRTSCNCTGSPEETTESKVSTVAKKWLITVLKVHDLVKRYQRDWRYRKHAANSPFSPGCWWRQISDGEPVLPLPCWNQPNHWFQEHRNAGSPYELLWRKKVSI